MNKKIIFACLFGLLTSGSCIANSHQVVDSHNPHKISHKLKKAKKSAKKSSCKSVVKHVEVFDADGTSYWVSKNSLHPNIQEFAGKKKSTKAEKKNKVGKKKFKKA